MKMKKSHGILYRWKMLSIILLFKILFCIFFILWIFREEKINPKKNELSEATQKQN